MQGTVAGVLLAGGLGRRMGGAEKALMPLAGRPLLEHAAARLAPQVGPLILNANGDPARFAALALPVVPDETPDRPGPLAGVLAALRWLARNEPGIRAVVSLPADAPFVPPDLVRRLSDALSAARDVPAAVAQSRGRRHHVIGLWSRDAAAEIAAALARGERKVEAMVDRLGAIAVPFADLDIGGRAVDPFFNINTPDDLAAAEEILAHSPPPLWGRAREGGNPEHLPSGFPPTLTPPHKGEGKAFVVGIAGWKNAGKTTLVARLVAELTRRGYRVSTVKHSHHDIAFEADDTDSARHRRAGAHEVAVLTPQRWAILHERRDTAEPQLADVLARLAPADIVLVEGLKGAPIPKIEVRGTDESAGPPLAETDPDVFAIATSRAAEDASRPVLSRNDIDGLVQTLLARAGLPPHKEQS